MDYLVMKPAILMLGVTKLVNVRNVDVIIRPNHGGKLCVYRTVDWSEWDSARTWIYLLTQPNTLLHSVS